MANNVNGINQNTNVFEQINKQNSASENSPASATSETSDMFMKLMIAQLKNQSPTSPADTSDYMQQIASMSNVEAINNMNNSIQQLSNSLISSQAALQASSMVGQMAYVQTDKGVLTEADPVKGVVTLPTSASDVRVSVYDASGTQVDTISLGSKVSGDHSFEWTGAGQPPGEYKLVAEALSGDEYKVAQSYIGYTVNSVTLGQNGIGMAVNTDAGAVGINDIKQIGQG